MVNLPGIVSQAIAVSHPIETLHRVPYTSSPLVKSFVALKVPEPIELNLFNTKHNCKSVKIL